MWRNGKYAQGTSAASCSMEVVLRKSTCMIVRIESWIRCFFSWNAVFKTDQLKLLDLSIWLFGSILLKMNEVSLSLQRLTVFVTNCKIWLFKWKLEFWNTLHLPERADSFPELKDLMRSMVTFTNVTFLDIVLWHECNLILYDIWNICKTQRTNIFQMTVCIQCYNVIYE